jgi:hypothetical protein
LTSPEIEAARNAVHDALPRELRLPDPVTLVDSFLDSIRV